MGKVINVDGFKKKDPITIVIGETEYTFTPPKVRQLKEATRIEQESKSGGEYDKLCAAIQTLAVLTGLPVDVFEDLDMEEIQQIQDAITAVSTDETEKNGESTTPVS